MADFDESDQLSVDGLIDQLNSPVKINLEQQIEAPENDQDDEITDDLLNKYLIQTHAFLVKLNA